MERMGGIWVLLAPGRLNRPMEDDEWRRHDRYDTGHTSLFCLHGGIGFVSRSMDVPATGLTFPHRQLDRICWRRAPPLWSAHTIPATFIAPSPITVGAVTLWRAVNLHFVFAPCARSFLAFSPIAPSSSVVSSRAPVIVPSITIPVVSSVSVAPLITVPVPFPVTTVAVPPVIVSGGAVSVFVIPVVICKKKGRRKGHAGKQNRTRRTRSVRLVVWGSVCVCGMCHGMGCTRSTLLFFYDWGGLAVDARAS